LLRVPASTPSTFTHGTIHVSRPGGRLDELVSETLEA